MVLVMDVSGGGGSALGVTALLGAESTDQPAPLSALTVKVYVVPLTRPFTVQVREGAAGRLEAHGAAHAHLLHIPGRQETGIIADHEAQVDGGGHLVDVLATGTLRAHGADVDLQRRNRILAHAANLWPRAAPAAGAWVISIAAVMISALCGDWA